MPVIVRVASAFRLSNVPGSSDVRRVLSERPSDVSAVKRSKTPAGSDVRPVLPLR